MINQEIAKVLHHIADMFQSGDCDKITDEERIRMFDQLSAVVGHNSREDTNHMIHRTAEAFNHLAKDVDDIHREIDSMKKNKEMKRKRYYLHPKL